MCWKVTFSHHFDNNFWTIRNFWTRPASFRKYTFEDWIPTQILYFFDRNQESFCPLNMSHRVTWNTDSTYVLMEGRKNGSQMIHSRIWQGNICPILRDQSSRNKILGKKYISDMLFTRNNRLENVLKSDFWSPFRL